MHAGDAHITLRSVCTDVFQCAVRLFKLLLDSGNTWAGRMACSLSQASKARSLYSPSSWKPGSSSPFVSRLHHSSNREPMHPIHSRFPLEAKPGSKIAAPPH